MKAIETRYNGHRFRSRTEARWAVFFDHLGVKFEYEPEGYELLDGTRYLPDFYAPNEDCFFEIKGTTVTEEEWAKAGMLAHATQKFVNILVGQPGKHELMYARPKPAAGEDLVAWLRLCPDERLAARARYEVNQTYAVPDDLVSLSRTASSGFTHHNHFWRVEAGDTNRYAIDFDDESGRLCLWKTHYFEHPDPSGLGAGHWQSQAQVMDGEFIDWFDEVRYSPNFYAAVSAAKSARFEFGESGAG